MSFFRQHSFMLTSVGTSVVIGIMYWRMTSRILQELQRLTRSLVDLQTEISNIKENIESTKRWRRPGSGSGSRSGFVTASSADEDDDIYEEAYGGSDLESVKELDEQRSGTPYKDTDELDGTHGPVQRDDVFKEVDKLLEGYDGDKERAFEILQNNRHLFLTDPEYHWRLSKTTFQLALIEEARGNPQKKKEYVYEAKDLAQAAVGLDDQCANAHKWFAITIGSVGEYEGTQQKIKNGFVYKEHIEKAISINATDPSNHYLLGRWCYSVYMLSWIERKAAATLFATPPTATVEDALKHFLKAEELNPGKWKENTLYISKCYVEMRQYKEATKWLKQAKQIPVISQDDKKAHEEVEGLLAKYQGY